MADIMATITSIFAFIADLFKKFGDFFKGLLGGLTKPSEEESVEA